MNAAFEATESDDSLRNIDVILRLRTLNFRTVINWILDHKCCPQIYKDQAKTDEGRHIATSLLKQACSKAKKQDMLLMKNQSALKYRLAPFVFEPWRELTKQNQNEQAKQNSEAEAKRLQELRQQLKEKEQRYKELRAMQEPAPEKEFMQSVSKAKKKKQKSLEYMGEYDKAREEAEAELETVAKELARLRKARRSRRQLSRYYKAQLEKVEVVAPRVGVLQRKRASAEERLKYEREQLDIAKRDNKTLIVEHEELDFTLEDYRDTAVFDATEVGSIRDPREERVGDKTSAPLSKKYREDVVEVIMELVDSGIESESVQSIFESVFKCVNFPVRGFPTNSVIKRLFKEHQKMDEEGKNMCEEI